MRMREEFIDFPPGNEDSHFSVDLAGISYCDENYLIRRKKSTVMVAEYIIKGRGTVILEGEMYEAKAGDIYILPAGVDHLYYPDSREPWEKIWFNVKGTLSSVLLREYNPKSIVIFQNAGGREFFEKLHAIGRDGEYTAVEKHRKAAVVFHEFLQYLYDVFYGKKIPISRETMLVKEYMDQHVDRNVSLKELASLVYLSESQVVRIFKRDMGRTPHEYGLSLKLEQGKKLLKNSNLRVKDIAEYLGFCDEHYFSYIFKNKVGKTPLEYKNGQV